MRQLFLIVLIFVIPVDIKAQELLSSDAQKTQEDVPWEKLFESDTEDEENTSAVDEVERLESNPLDINTASLEELHCIPAMTNIVASKIIGRRELAPIASFDELKDVEGMTQEMLSFIRIFTRIKNAQGRPSISGSFLNRTSMEIEKRKGFMTSDYPGQPVKILNKFRISAGDDESPISSVISKIDAGYITEKDPGERSFKDFSSGFVGISIPAISTQLIIGSYQVEAAEGLMFWRASGFYKGSDVIAPMRKNGSGIQPYLSNNENSYMQGIALSLNLDHFQLQMFYSDKSINAAIDTLGQISNIDQGGLFRTETELLKKNSTREAIIGCRAAAYIYDGLKFGATAYRTRFKNPLILKKENADAVNNLWMKGMDVSFTNKNIDMFAEVAADRSHKVAIIGGLTYEPVTSFSVSLSARNYPSEFQSIHGNAFGESGRQVQNENGVYVGIRVQPIDWLLLSTYYDQFNHTMPNQLFPVSSYGSDFLALAEFRIANDYDFAVRFKRKESLSAVDICDSYGRTMEQVIPRIQENYRLTSQLILSSSVRFVNRIEWSNVMYNGLNKSEQGLLISQTIKCKLLRSFALRARIAVFDTDSYDSKIYEYEDDLTRTSFNPALFGRGIRWYLTGRYGIFKDVDIAAKYSQTIKDGIKSIGSGLDEIEGNTQTLLSLYLHVRF